MPPHLLLTFWAVAVVLIVVPGPDWAFVLATGGRERTILPAVGGLMTGYCVLTAVVAAGVGPVVAGSASALTVLTAAGSGYLVLLGTALLRQPGQKGDAPDTRPGAVSSLLARGVAVSGLNPKGLLMFLAVLPQFTDRHGPWPMPAQLAALGLIFVASCGVFYLALGFGARAIVITRPGAGRTLSRVSGAAMIAVGVVLVVERARQLAG
jgi:threonine/homoserine/homoserine lactone efflux protein